MARALLIAAGLLVLAAPAPAQDFDCSDPDSLPQQGMNICAAEEFEAADAELNDAWGELRRHLQRSEQEYEGYEGWFQTALAAQRAWLAYRDAQCEAEGKVAEGGSMQPMLVSGCLARLTKARTDELAAMLAAE